MTLGVEHEMCPRFLHFFLIPFRSNIGDFNRGKFHVRYSPVVDKPGRYSCMVYNRSPMFLRLRSAEIMIFGKIERLSAYLISCG